MGKRSSKTYTNNFKKNKTIMEQKTNLKDFIELPTEVAINIRNFFGRTTAPLDEIGLNNIVALENAIVGAVIKDEDVVMPKSQTEEIKEDK